jgi:hypothetical protein
MRTLPGPAVVLWLVGAMACVCAADEQQARSILNKAIEAAGGEEALGKYKSATWEEEGTYYGMGEGVSYTGEYAMQSPDQFKMEITDVFAVVVNKDKGWLRTEGETREMSADDLAEMKEQMHAGWTTMLIPLKDPKYKLEAVGEKKVDTRTAVGIKVSREGHRDVTLYFDKSNHLLAQSEATVKSDELGGKEVLEEITYNGYRRIDGVMTPLMTRIKRDGERYVDSRITEMKYAEALDESVFSKP